MPGLFLKAYLSLLLFDWYVSHTSFPSLYARVRNCPISVNRSPSGSVEEICSAIDRAAIWYWKEVLCLQRSAATTCLLRRHGVPAQMVIGVRQLPFKAHAWVEVAGSVVNDKPYTPGMYAELDRC